MASLLWNALKASPVICGVFFLGVNSVCANQIPSDSEQTLAAIREQLTSAESPTVEQPSHVSQVQVEQPNLPVEVNPTIDFAGNTLAQVTPTSDAATLPPESSSSLEQIDVYSDEGSVDDAMEQVTNVNQLRDVSPGDWAYEALRSLVERYGCIVGYPDGTYRGNRATTRYEFAAGLNACLNQIERLIAASTEGFVRREDLETLQRLVQEFQAELATLGTRVDTLEGRVAFLEENQFSTTTRLNGEVDMGFVDAFGDRLAVPSGQTPTADLDVNTIFAGRAILNFDTSFTGRDRLRTKLEAGNLSALTTGTDMTLYDFDTFTRTGSDIATTVDTGNNFVLGSLVYQFPITNNAQVFISAKGQGADGIAPQLNPAGGGVSRFGQRNPLYRISDGTGIGVNFVFGETLAASLTYLGNTDFFSDPGPKNGVFNGQFGALAQLTFTPSQRFGLALTYVRYYSPEPGDGINVTGNTGSDYAQTPFGDDTATSANAYGLQAQYRFSPGLAIGGWVGFTEAQAESNSLLATQGDEAEIWNYAVTLAFPDLGGDGNLLGFIFGMPPRVRGNDIASRRDFDTTYHIEGFYRYRLTDNIALTPGVFVILNPEHNDANDTIVVGTFRTTFTF